MFHDQADMRTVKVFKNGRSRAVRIPKEFDFGGDEMIMRQQSDGTITLEPVERRKTPAELVEWLRARPRLMKEDFPQIDDGDMLPIDDVEL